MEYVDCILSQPKYTTFSPVHRPDVFLDLCANRTQLEKPVSSSHSARSVFCLPCSPQQTLSGELISYSQSRYPVLKRIFTS